MKDHIKAFQFSLLVHLVAIVFLLTMSTRLIQNEPVLVIDLSDTNSLSLHNQGVSRNNPLPFEETKKSLKTSEQETVVPPLISELPVQYQRQPLEIEREKEIVEEPQTSTFVTGKKTSMAFTNPSEDNEPSSSESGRPPSSFGNIVGADFQGNENMGKTLYLRKHFLYIRDIIQRNILYPTLARKMGWQGKVTISFLIMPDGNVIDIRIAKSSGKNILDRNAVETVKRVSPFPPPPLKAEITVPVVYALQ